MQQEVMKCSGSEMRQNLTLKQTLNGNNFAKKPIKFFGEIVG